MKQSDKIDLRIAIDGLFQNHQVNKIAFFEAMEKFINEKYPEFEKMKTPNSRKIQGIIKSEILYDLAEDISKAGSITEWKNEIYKGTIHKSQQK